jgi:4'-phosphopantetheinyl transferase
VAPGAVELSEGPHGKPEVAGAALRFNVSHTGDLALIALADVEVGVDVERASRSTRAVLRTLTPRERAAGPEGVELLRIWCRKEALAKAIGGGLGWAPEEFDTTAPGPYWLTDLAVREGYVAALAVAGGPARVELRTNPV